MAAWTTTVDCGFADVELVDTEWFIGSLPAEFGAVRDSPCRASGGGAAAVATGVSGVAASCATSDGTGSAEDAGTAGCSVGDAAAGGSAGAANATPEGTPVWVGVAPADAVVSLLDGVELACAPPELCTTPERGSAVEASLGEEVELAWASTELCTTPDVEPDEEAAAEADESVDDVGSVDDVLAADSDDELDVDDDEPDDEREELVSVGAANATPGVVATAPPTPSANASAPARIMYCAFTGIALRGQPARAPAERPPEPASSARWDPAAVKAILATFLADAVGLRCGLLMAVSSLYAPTRSAVGFGLERLPGRRLFSGWKRRRLHPKGPQAAPGSDFGGPVGSPASIHGGCWCPRPTDGARRERAGRARRWERLGWLGARQ